jgi:hypothetical protein
MSRALVLASPFLIGLIWSLFSPLLVRHLGGRFQERLDQILQEAGFQESPQGAPRRATACARPRTPEAGTPRSSPATASEPVGAVIEADGISTPTERGSSADEKIAPAAPTTSDSGCAIPLPLRSANLRTYVEWLVDVPQLLPTILLAAVGVFITVAEGGHLLFMYVICAVAALVGVIATVLIMKMKPQSYTGVSRFWIYTLGPLIGIIVNFVAAVIIVGVTV